MVKEEIIKAAIKFEGKVYTGFNHGECFHQLEDQNATMANIVQGFITSSGRFVDRKQAMVIAKEAGQVESNLDKESLISEDLYLDWLHKGVDLRTEDLEKVRVWADEDFRKHCYINAVELEKFINNLKDEGIKMDKSKWGVHIAHCCYIHGCKYGDEDCPVANGEVKQEGPCWSCTEGEDEPYTIEEIDELRKTKSKGLTYKELKEENKRLHSELSAKVDYIQEIVKVKDDFKQQLLEKDKKIDEVIRKDLEQINNQAETIAKQYERIRELEYKSKINKEITEMTNEVENRIREGLKLKDKDTIIELYLQMKFERDLVQSMSEGTEKEKNHERLYNEKCEEIAALDNSHKLAYQELNRDYESVKKYNDELIKEKNKMTCHIGFDNLKYLMENKDWRILSEQEFKDLKDSKEGKSLEKAKARAKEEGRQEIYDYIEFLVDHYYFVDVEGYPVNIQIEKQADGTMRSNILGRREGTKSLIYEAVYSAMEGLSNKIIGYLNTKEYNRSIDNQALGLKEDIEKILEEELKTRGEVGNRYTIKDRPKM